MSISNFLNFFLKNSKQNEITENVINHLNSYADIFNKIDDQLLAINCTKNLVKDQYNNLLEKRNIKFENAVANSVKFTHNLVWPNQIEGGSFKIHATFITGFNKASNTLKHQLISFPNVFTNELNSFVDFLKTYGGYKDHVPSPKRLGPEQEITLISPDYRFEISTDDPNTEMGNNRIIRIILL